MASSSLFASRSLRLRSWSVEGRAVDGDRMAIEAHLRRLGDFKVEPCKTLDDPGLFPCDLLIVFAHKVPEEEFLAWLRSFRQRLVGKGAIWTPVLILAEVSFDALRDFLPEAASDNWYFDILAPRHMSSLPMRVANLLRIHDHLHEIKRYAEALDEISARVKSLEALVGQAEPKSKSS